MNKCSIAVVGVFSLLFLGGCAGHIHTLTESESEVVLTGYLLHDDPVESNRLVINRGGKRFEGSFLVEQTQNWQELRKRYRSNPRHWGRIFSGLDRDHLVSTTRAELKSEDGATLVCDLAWRRDANPAGVCEEGNGNGEPFAVQFDPWTSGFTCQPGAS